MSALAQHCTQSMSPGTYLQKRRIAAHLGVLQTAATLAAAPWAIIQSRSSAIPKLAQRLNNVEADRQFFSRNQLETLRDVFAFDPEIYLQLVDLHAAGPGCGLPEPQICSCCACSWHDPCLSPATLGHSAMIQPCAWSDTTPNMCTACAGAPAAQPISAAAVPILGASITHILPVHRPEPEGASN